MTASRVNRVPTPLSHSPVLQQLQVHYQQMCQQGLELNQLFDQPDRFAQFSLSAAGLFLDYSKNQLTEATLALLCELAREQQVERQRDAMFAGEKINFTEQRSVLHTALRAPVNIPHWVDGINVNAEVHAVLDQMQEFVEKIHSGA